MSLYVLVDFIIASLDFIKGRGDFSEQEKEWLFLLLKWFCFNQFKPYIFWIEPVSLDEVFGALIHV